VFIVNWQKTQEYWARLLLIVEEGRSGINFDLEERNQLLSCYSLLLYIHMCIYTHMYILNTKSKTNLKKIGPLNCQKVWDMKNNFSYDLIENVWLNLRVINLFLSNLPVFILSCFFLWPRCFRCYIELQMNVNKWILIHFIFKMMLWGITIFLYLRLEHLRNYFFFSTGAWTQGLTLIHSTSPFFCVKGFFEIGSHRLFAQAGFESRSSWSLPPE
jgi:hypothetical protein